MNLKDLISFYYSPSGQSYYPDAVNYFNELTGTLNTTFKNAINWGVENLKTSGNWDKIDRLFWYAVPNSQNTTVSVVNPTSEKATMPVALDFVSGEWLKGNGAGYQNLKYNPVDDGVNFTQNNAGFTVVTMQHGLYGAGGLQFGELDGTYRNTIYFSGGRAYASLNSDTSAGVVGQKTAGVFTATRINNTQFRLFRDGVEDGNSPFTQSSATPTNYDFYGFAWNYLNAPDSPSTQPILCIIIHSGDVDVSALNQTIKGIVSRLNGGYKITQLNLNTAMNPMDSCCATKLSDTVLGLFGGYDPLETNSTTDKWYTTTDGITFTYQGTLPTKVAHLTAQLRNDGFVWAFGSNPVDNKHFCWKLNVNTLTWTVVNGDLTAGDLAGLGTVQWGFFHKDEMYWALSSGGSNVQLWKSSNGNNWSFVSTLANYAFNSAAYSDGTAIRYTGGGDQTTNLITNIYESLDNGATWSVIRSLPARLQSLWPSYFKFNNQEFLITGRNLVTAIYEGGIYRWNGTDWVNTLLPELSGRHAIAHAEFLGGIFLINGYLYNDCYKLETI